MPVWTTPALIAESLGPTAAPALDDPLLARVADAANTAAYLKRQAAGHVDDPLAEVAPNPAVQEGTTLWAVALWRERGSTDGYSSYQGLETFTPTGGSWGQIKRLLRIGRGQVDTPMSMLPELNPLRRHRSSSGWWPR